MSINLFEVVSQLLKQIRVLRLSTLIATGVMCLCSGRAIFAEEARVPAAEKSAIEQKEDVKKNALWFLRNEPKPVFAKNHTLIPLSRWGWALPYEVRVELCENWGYALDLPETAIPVSIATMDKPESDVSRLLALAKSDPKRYPLSVLVPRPLLDQAFQDAIEKDPVLGELTWVRDTQGKKFDAPTWKTWSPETPLQVYEKAAAQAVETLKKVQAKAPIAILLNGGEYGLTVLGHSQQYWSKDPRVLAAKGDWDWSGYISERKAQQESVITDAVRKQFPDRRLYLWYHFGFLPGATAYNWSYEYEPMRAVSDYPGQSIYYRHYNTGWSGNNDLLSNFLASVALASPFGDTLSYNWVCAGWESNGNFSERDRYMGFLKCLYTGGQIGAVAGYFSYPKGGFANPNMGDEAPSWLWQTMDLGQVQALFSHLEPFIRNGDLLPGPDKNRVVKTVAANEFPTGDPNARVLARKMRGRDEWLITAWAATGDARNVSVNIPGLGDVSVLARPAGSVYRATLKQVTNYEPPSPQLTLLDKDATYPSAGFKESQG